MKFFSKKIILIILLPLVFILQYYFFKFGVIEPMVKGINIDIVDGDYVRDLDKFTMKLNDTVTLSSGEYVVIPSYAKSPKIWFKVLDNDGVLKIEGKKVTSLKEGISSIAIMKDTRVLKKINIRVIDPKVENLTVDISNGLNFVGDTASIESSIEVDYDKFKQKEKIEYKSTNENVLKIDDNKITATGVGDASIIVDAGEKKEYFDYSIKARIKNINVKNNINLIVGEKKNLNVSIETSPKGLKHDKVRYQIISNNKTISIDNKGNIVALKKGVEKVKVICQNKSKIITVNVSNKPISDQKIKNLEVLYNKLEDKIIIYFIWDFMEEVYDYDIYINKNYTNFELLHSVKVDNTNKKVKATLEVSTKDLEHISLYVVGKKEDKNSKISDIVDIKIDNKDINQNEESIEDKKVNNIHYEIVNSNLNIYWDDIGIDDCYYSLYIKDNLSLDDGFVLYESNIKDNFLSIYLDTENYDFDFYVISSKDGIYSIQSDSINIKN